MEGVRNGKMKTGKRKWEKMMEKANVDKRKVKGEINKVKGGLEWLRRKRRKGEYLRRKKLGKTGVYGFDQAKK